MGIPNNHLFGAISLEWGGRRYPYFILYKPNMSIIKKPENSEEIKQKHILHIHL